MPVQRLTPEQVTSYWKLIQQGFEESLPPYTYQSGLKDNRLLTQLLTGNLTAWTAVENNQIKIVMTTTIIDDELSGVRNLLIYTLANVGNLAISEDLWLELRDVLVPYARAFQCYKIMAYSSVPAIVKVATQLLGAEVESAFLSLEISPLEGVEYSLVSRNGHSEESE